MAARARRDVVFEHVPAGGAPVTDDFGGAFGGTDNEINDQVLPDVRTVQATCVNVSDLANSIGVEVDVDFDTSMGELVITERCFIPTTFVC